MPYRVLQIDFLFVSGNLTNERFPRMKMTKVALFGNVNTEEIVAKRLVNEGVIVDGYLLFPNDAFAKVCRKSVILSEKDENYRNNTLLQDLRREHYDVIMLGPDFTVGLASEILRQGKIPHIGATPSQLLFETDKSLVTDAIGKNVMPRRLILTAADQETLKHMVSEFDHGYVLKFVGDYTKKYPGSPVGRVRLSGETINGFDEVYSFIANSIEVSGKCIVEEKLVGREFSSNYAVDQHGALFRLGENICYKRRNNDNMGPMCDGTGSVSINNTLPFLTEEDISFVEKCILTPFLSSVKLATGYPVTTIINLDLMKMDDGCIMLLEVNCREAGGHTMANILSGLDTPLIEILKGIQEGTLHSLTPTFKKGASLVVSAYPPYFPFGTSDEKLIVCDVAIRLPDDVSLFTGWVDVLEETAEYRRLRIRNSPALLFEHRNDSMVKARKHLYDVMSTTVPQPLEFRTDIGEKLL